MMDKYLDFLFKRILEAADGSEMPVYYSNRLREMLQKIDDDTGNEVAHRLLWSEGESSKRVFIDIDDNSIDKITFLMSSKADDILKSNHERPKKYLDFETHELIYKSSQRVPMKINKFVNELFNKEYETKKLTDEQKKYNAEHDVITPPQHLENFINLFKAMREPGEFELVSGQDLIYWYNGNNYERFEEHDGSTLWDSCMKYDGCSSYLDFYGINHDKVSLLIMKQRDDDTKITARALVWQLSEPSGRTYMDRIYTTYEHDAENFKSYAKQRNWLYKYKQNMESSEKIVDPVTGEISKMKLVVDNMEENNGEYPYLDTLKYYYPNLKLLMNNNTHMSKDKYFYLAGTDGTDYERFNNRSIYDLREMYVDEILGDIEYYATNYASADQFWDAVDNEKYMREYISGEKDYYRQDLEYLFEPEDIIAYIITTEDEDTLPEDINDLNSNELVELLDTLGIMDNFIEHVVEERYGDYTAKDVYEEIYGYANGGVTEEMFKQFKYYIDEDELARNIAENESEYDLRERFDDDD